MLKSELNLNEPAYQEAKPKSSINTFAHTISIVENEVAKEEPAIEVVQHGEDGQFMEEPSDKERNNYFTHLMSSIDT